MQGSTLPPGY
jgi:hypothetical protein